ncbi:MAG: AAA family ATPase [Planctomycetes bacterium]|nr:AAA family ATPase [Planctomycetota bacterium]
MIRAIDQRLTSWKRGGARRNGARGKRPVVQNLFGQDESASEGSEERGRKGVGSPGNGPSPRVRIADVNPVDLRARPPVRQAAIEVRRDVVPTRPEARPDVEPVPYVAPGSETFQNFVWDKRNAIAYRAVLDTARRPRRLTQMLFLYGERGLGKTHLLRASKRELEGTGARVVLLEAERLVTRYVLACEANAADDLFAELDRGDVLILDEVHRLGLKDGSCGFAERLVSSYLESGRLVIVASRHHPHAIYGLTGRQASLFMAGFVVRLDPPMAPTRERWLRQVHRFETGEEPPREVHLLAQAIDGGLGELRYAHHRFLLGTPLEEIVETQRPDMDLVVTLVAQAFSVSQDELVGRPITRNVSAARDVACFVATRLGFRAASIGAHLGGRSATTVRQARKRCTDRMARDSRSAKLVKDVLQHLFGQQAG